MLEVKDLVVDSHCCEGDTSVGLRVSPSKTVSLECWLPSLRGGKFDSARIQEMKKFHLFDATKNVEQKNATYYKYLAFQIIQRLEKEWQKPLSSNAKHFIEQEVTKEMQKEFKMN
jgi:hypothetical protein